MRTLLLAVLLIVAFARPANPAERLAGIQCTHTWQCDGWHQACYADSLYSDQGHCGARLKELP